MFLTTAVHVDYWFFQLQDAGEFIQPAPFGPNGLVNASPTMVYIYAGMKFGLVAVSVDIRDEAPRGNDLDAWDDVVEISVHVNQELQLLTWDNLPPTPEVPVLTPHGPGDYRLRVHARNRDLGEIRPPDAAPDEFLLVIWPAPPAPEIAYKLTDQTGARYRAEFERAMSTLSDDTPGSAQA